MSPRKPKDPRRWMRLRLWIVGGFFVLAGAVLAGRAVDLQVVERGFLAAKAQREILREVEVAPNRGIIYDRNQVELALSLGTDSVYARPVAVRNPVREGRLLAGALGLPAGPVIKRLRGKRHFAWIQRRVDPDQAEAVKALGLDSVGLVSEPRRFYPYTSLASHVLGFAGLDAKGLEGLERRYDKVLTGQGRRVTRARDALGRTFWLAGQRLQGEPQGGNLILTIDRSLQYQVEKILAGAVKRWKATAGQAVVMVPATGEILAMASVPAFNPNVYQRYPRETYRNRVVTDFYEPGSTFKVFMAAAALDSGKVSMDQRFDCEDGAWKVGGRVIHDTHPHGKLTLSEIVKFSSNIGAAKVAQQVGPVQLYATLKAFGFGRPTGVDLPGEARGLLRPARSWRPVEMANIAFGQGVAVTPLQLTAAVAAVANNGVLMRPFVVKAMVDGSGRLVAETQPQVRGRVLGPTEARLLGEMMRRVTEPGGTGQSVKVPPFQVAGKTGTAQKLKPEGGYSHTDYMSSFVGYLPADDPQAAILVVIDRPRGRHYGGTVAGPAWAAIAKATLKTLGVHRPLSLPELRQVRGQEPAAPAAPVAPAAPGPDTVRALAQGKAPDLSGLTLRQVLALAGRAGLKVRASGWGRVAGQSPAPGAPLKDAEALEVRLAPPTGGA
ncbi:MAG: transpeptidase family protein [Desulfarculaceae bacterium]|nr:transpeptidase family protein [Desulfarculaceae bacterium]MCF8100489.1 transpeptidase family protein [Desulfarculaceae bacterium]MCF8118096.1 transpeptidase family protein [Desulfarculaceae bacterium]